MATRIRVLAGVRDELGQALRAFIHGQPDLELIDCIEDGKRLVEQLAIEEADALVVDLLLPGLDGLAVLEELPRLAVSKRPKVLVLTPSGPDALIARLVDAGADYVLVKPTSMELVGARLRQVVAGNVGVSHARSPRSAPSQRRVQLAAESSADRLLREIGLPPHMNGFAYLRLAIELVSRDLRLISAVTKELYPAIARHHQTTASCVERSIRHAIEVVWSCKENRRVRVLFPHSAGKPSNSEFIALMATTLEETGGQESC